MSNPLISVCIPVYNGARYIEETLDRIYVQNYNRLEILISIDLSTDNSVDLCNRIKNPNTKIFVSPVRLGWVENCNFLISQSSGDYYSIIPQDDLIPVNYYEKLLYGFASYPNAVNCYPYIICFGKLSRTIHQKSITGTLPDRINDVIHNHCVAVSFRGLIKNNLSQTARFLNGHQHQNLMADSIWILQHALEGDLCAIDVPYYKRYHKTNEHTTWINKSLADKILAWAGHCAALYTLSVHYVEEKDKLYQNCVKRLLNQKINPLKFSIKEETQDLLNIFEEKIRNGSE